MTAAFAGGGANFTTVGLDPSDVVYRGGAGLEFNAPKGMEFTLRYDINGRNDYTDQAVSGNFRMLF